MSKRSVGKSCVPGRVIATGTFLDAGYSWGRTTSAARGRRRGLDALAEQVRELGLAKAWGLKTGTPPRLDGRTIDWARLEEQPSDREEWTMSALDDGVRQPQLRCAITRTNERTHEIIAANFARSPLFAGAIEGRGPRYCPRSRTR